LIGAKGGVNEEGTLFAIALDMANGVPRAILARGDDAGFEAVFVYR
jgi:hypothetical protein